MPKIINKQAKKLEIIQAAMKVFAQNGFANTKMAEIAVAAKIGKGTIYEYFKNKDEIFEFVFNHFMEFMETTIARAIFKITDPVEKIKTIFNSWTEIVSEEHTEFIDIMLDFWAEAVRRKEEQKLKIVDLEKVYEEFRIIIKSILDEGVRLGKFKPVDTYLAASLILGSMDGIMIQWILNKKIFDLREAMKCSMKVLLTGICVD